MLHFSPNMDARCETKTTNDSFRAADSADASRGPDVTKSLRRRRRHQRDAALMTQPNNVSVLTTTSLQSTTCVVQCSKQVQNTVISSFSSPPDEKPALRPANSFSEQDAVFSNGLEKPQAFVRNSSLRRSRRSRKSTAGSSRSSENESDICKSSVGGASERLARVSSERLSTTGAIPEEALGSGTAEDRIVARDLRREHISPPKVESLADASSPGISPYRSPSTNSVRENAATPKRTSVSYVQGATCQYKTISTSFRGPLWNPVSSAADTLSPVRLRQRQNSNNSNNIGKDFSQAEWHRSDQHASKNAASQDHSSPQPASANGYHQHYQQKNSARVVLKALGKRSKRLFSAKGKTPTASGQRTPLTEGVANSYKESNSFCAETPKSRHALQPSPFQQRKEFFEQSPAKVAHFWEQPRKDTFTMAGVASLPRAGAGESRQFAKNGRAAFEQEVRGSEGEEDAGESSVAELEDLLKQYTDRDKRAKIRETIRLLKQDLQQGDSPASENHQSSYKPVRDSHHHLKSSTSPVEFSVSSQHQTPLSSLSRFTGRSTSLRNPRPPYQPPSQAVHRANSFKLCRPKDFIPNNTGSSPLLTKVPETVPAEHSKEYADSLNNNISNYTAKVADPTSATHNKTASPFAVSLPAAFRKQVWSPPASSYSDKQQNTPVGSFATVGVRSAPASTLRRSESAKENRFSDAPPISVTRGNVRRSKSILGRILGQKIDTEKTSPSWISPTFERQKPSLFTSPKSEPPKPAPRKKHSAKSNLDSRHDSTDLVFTKPPDSLPRTFNSARREPENLTDESPKFLSETQEKRLVNGLDTDTASDKSSAPSKDEQASVPSNRHSHTLSEIIQANREQQDSETSSVPLTAEDDQTTSSVPRLVTRDHTEEPESDKLSTGDGKEEFLQQDSAQVEHSDSELQEKISPLLDHKPQSTATKSRIVHECLKSHTVRETERVQLFNVHIVHPIDPRPRQSPHDPRKQSVLNETRRLSTSSSSSSLTSESEDSNVLSSDDEASDSEDCDMDRYSSRALQNRSSVKSQILAKENDVNASSAAKTSSSKRVRERRNNPLNTGADLRSRMQRFNQSNGEAATEKTPPSKRNGNALVSETETMKLSSSKFDKSRDDDAKLPSPGKVSTRHTTASSRSTSSEEKPREDKVNSSSERESPPAPENGTSILDEKTESVSSSGSATEDSSRARRRARAKLGAEKLERASKTVTQELTSGRSGDEIVISTRKSRARAPAEDANEGAKSADVAAPSNENAEKLVEDSLSGWSARRRKKRQPVLAEFSVAASDNINEKSAEEIQVAADEAEEAKEAKAALKHVTHSAPALAELEQSLSGYTVKLSINSETKLHEEAPITEENADEAAGEEDDTKRSRVRRRVSRSSDNGSSTSSANSEIEKSQDKSPTSPSEDDLPAEIVMEVGSECDDATDQSVANEVDATERNSENERAEVSDEQEESKERSEREVVEEKATDEEGEHDLTTVDDVDELADSQARDEEITENKCHFGDESDQTQTISLDTPPETIYKPDASEPEPQTEALPAEEESVLEVARPEPPASKDTPVSEQPIEETAEHVSVREEEPTDDSTLGEQPKRRHHRERKGKVDKELAEAQEERPKHRHRGKNRHKKSEGEDKSEEKTPKETKADSKDKKLNKEEREPRAKVETEETPKPSENTPVESKAEPQEESKERADQSPKTMHFSYDNIEEITDIKLLEKMLDASSEYEHRRRIRSVIRALKRGEKPTVVKDRKYDAAKSNGTLSAIQALRARKNELSRNEDNEKKDSLSPDGTKETRVSSSRTTVTRTEKTELGSKYTTTRTERTTTRMTSGQKKIGSIFDRGDDEEDTRKTTRTSGSSRLGDLERRQAERRRELQRNRSMPATSSKDARKAFVAKLESSTPKTQQTKKVGRSPTFVVPNANNVKQLLLKWCQSKTRGYENVDVRNFSSSWASGMAFCALVHNFFPDAFDYEKLEPKNRAENFSLAFTKADELGEVPQLLDAEDMISMAEPDWKCVYTYIGEFYKRIRDLGLN